MTRKPARKTAKAFAEERRQDEAALMRLYGALFGHWRECPAARCRRARACAGEPVACFRGWWRAMTEEQREERRDVLRALIALGPAAR